jgi:hypothetical protein
MIDLLKIISDMMGKTTSTKLDEAQANINVYGITPVDSSWIEFVQYDPNLKALKMTLDDGSKYTYYAVTEAEYENVIAGGSPGKAINRIKNSFHPFVRGN